MKFIFGICILFVLLWTGNAALEHPNIMGYAIGKVLALPLIIAIGLLVIGAFRWIVNRRG